MLTHASCVVGTLLASVKSVKGRQTFGQEVCAPSPPAGKILVTTMVDTIAIGNWDDGGLPLITGIGPKKFNLAP